MGVGTQEDTPDASPVRRVLGHVMAKAPIDTRVPVSPCGDSLSLPSHQHSLV